MKLLDFDGKFLRTSDDNKGSGWIFMVRCAKCGTDNEEGARYCVQCGASLRPSSQRYEKYEKTERDVCFGPPETARYFWLIVGAAVILWGVSELVRIYTPITLEVWPFILIAIGLYIVYRILSRERRE